LIELGIAIVRNLENAVFDAKRIPEVVAQLIALDLDLPAIEVLAIEKGNPALGITSLLGLHVARIKRGDQTATEQSRDLAFPLPGTSGGNRSLSHDGVSWGVLKFENGRIDQTLAI